MKITHFNDVLASLPVEEQEEIDKMAYEMYLDWRIQSIREALEITQKELADALGVAQPSVATMEKRGKDIKLSSLKRYIEAMGGKLNLSVHLPTGKRISFQI